MKKKYIIAAITILLLAGAILIFVFLNNSNKKQNGNTNEETTTEKITTSTIIIRDENNSEISDSYINSRGEIVIGNTPFTKTSVKCTASVNGEDYNYTEDYTFYYYADNNVYSALRLITIKYANEEKYNEFTADRVFGESVNVISETYSVLERNIEITDQVYNPDNITLDSLETYTNYLKEKGYSCELGTPEEIIIKEQPKN